MTPRSTEQLGRRHHRVSLISTEAYAALAITGLALAALALWHVAITLCTPVPFTNPGATFGALLRLRPFTGLPAPMRPDSAMPTVIVWLALVTGVLLLGVWLMVRGARRDKPAAGLADAGAVRRSAGEIRAREAARHVRAPSIAAGLLDPQRCDLSEVGFHLGRNRDTREPVVLTLEDQVGILGPTGSGKSVYLSVRAALDAPGPLVATSTKPELLDAIAEARSALGRVHVFDPLDIAAWPQRMVWDPVAGAQYAETAVARGEAFTGAFAKDDGANNPFFGRAAGIIIARLLHAAALHGAHMGDVIQWALDLDRSTIARDILETHHGAEAMWAQTLQTAMEGADETISSVRMTLAQKVEPLLSRKVLDQLTPRTDEPVFDPAEFVTSTDTLIIITDDNARSNVAPLAAMLLNEIIDAAKYVAARSMHGRLDPPLRIVGDEIANVAPLPKLPPMLSDSRGVGIQWLAIFQSVAQMTTRWGSDGADQILANLNAALVLGGLQDTDALERFSNLVGSTDVVQVTSSIDAQHTGTGHNIALTERRTLRAEEIRQIPHGQALLLYRNAPAMLIQLDPWYERPDAAHITASIEHTRRRRLHPEAP